MALDDFEFLKSLDDRLHYTVKGNYKPNMYGPSLQVIYHKYHREEKLSSYELNRILGLMNKEEYALFPINTDMGFKAGFAVSKIGLEGMLVEAKTILLFTVDQLPKGVKWSQLAKCYMNKRNRELLELAKLPNPRPSQDDYDY